jgi:hypothetical protein
MDQSLVETVLRRLALQAGARIMEVYDRGGEMDVRAKDDLSPVTEADELADALISAGLAEAFPDVLVVTEENADTHSAHAARFFIVDPLDGTKEFVKRRGDFTVNIALVENGVPVRGVVYAPAKGRMFYTRADGTVVEEAGPFDLDLPGPLTQLRVRRPDNAGLMGGGVEIAPRCGHRRLHRPLRREGADECGVVAEILPRGDGGGGFLPAPRADDGVGHGGGPCGACGRWRARAAP